MMCTGTQTPAWETDMSQLCKIRAEVDVIFLLFIYLFLAALDLCCFLHRLSLVEVSWVCSSLWCLGFSLQWLLLFWRTHFRTAGSRYMGLSSCSTWSQQLQLSGSRAWAQQLWHSGLVTPRHVGSSQTKDQTRVPCIGSQIPNH